MIMDDLIIDNYFIESHSFYPDFDDFDKKFCDYIVNKINKIVFHPGCYTIGAYLRNINKLNIKSVWFGYIGDDINVISEFIKNTKIRKLSFDCSSINYDDLRDITKCIKNNKNITKLSITNYDYDAHCAMISIFNIKHLKYLSLRGIGDNYDDLMELISNLLKNNTSLITFKMKGIKFHFKYDWCIINAILFNRSLRHVYIGKKFTKFQSQFISDLINIDINKSLQCFMYDNCEKIAGQLIWYKLESNRQLFADIIDNRARVIFYISEMMEFYVNLPINVYTYFNS